MEGTGGPVRCPLNATFAGHDTVPLVAARRKSSGTALHGTCSARTMQLLEHQAKQRAQAVGLVVPNGHLVRSPDEAGAAAAGLRQQVVVKAQVPIGGRSKAGGIVVTDQQEVAPVASRLIGSEIAGYRVAPLLIEEYVPAKYE